MRLFGGRIPEGSKAHAMPAPRPLAIINQTVIGWAFISSFSE